MYARGVNVNLTPLTSNRGALATDTRGCSLWRYLLERPPPTWESRVRDPLGTRYELGQCGPGRGCYIGAVTRTGVRFRGVNVTDVYARGVKNTFWLFNLCNGEKNGKLGLHEGGG